MHYYFRHKHWQTYVLNLSNNLIRRVSARNLFISSKLSLNVLSKLSPKSPKTALLVLALLLLSSSWNVQANSKKVRAGNRSDAIIMLSPVIDYARPNLLWGDSISASWNLDFNQFAGPPDIWDPDHGFLVKPADRSSYDLNFPTTGAHNLFFDLLITGIEPEELTWAPVTHEGITATVTNDGGEYVIFGHSLGGLMAFELTHYILQHGHPMPKIIFFSGSRPPDRVHDEVILHTLTDAEFMYEIAKLGGMSGDVFRNKELMDIFTPIIKNDYRLYEQYSYQTKPQLLNCPVVLLHGDTDSLVALEELPQWQKFTAQETKTIIFPQADHFFVDKKYKEVVNIVNQTITEVTETK